MSRNETRKSDGVKPSGPDTAVSDLITVRDWLRWAVSSFSKAGLSYGHGTDNALDEAAFLILETLHLPIDQLDPWLDARLTAAERQTVHDIIERRISTRKPASYLTGSAYIRGRRFIIDENVIVPRSYIGELIDEGRFDDLVAEGASRILDLCTGSGCLAILAALRFPDALVDAVDVSRKALDVAHRNLVAFELTDRIALIEGDLFAPVSGRRYDLIIANPPYVAAAEVTAFPPEHAAEPVLAHLGGTDGLDLARRILANAQALLASGGTLVIEIGTGRDILEAEFPQWPFVWLDTEASEGEVLMIGAEDLAGAGRKRGRRT